jgi:hypothetical protein
VQTEKVGESFFALFPQVTAGAACDICVNSQLRCYFWLNSS